MMTRLPIALVFFLFLISCVQAQDSRFGIRLGPSFTTVGGEGSEGDGYVVGYHIGGYYRLPLQNRLTFEPGIQWATKGTLMNFVGIPGKVRSRNSYLDVPLLMKYDASKTVFFIVGAQPSFLLNASRVYTNNDEKIVDDRDAIREFHNAFDFAGILGIGFNTIQGINFQLTYEHGFANISAIGDRELNRGFKLSIGKSF
jgi:hypothetical protein